MASLDQEPGRVAGALEVGVRSVLEELSVIQALSVLDEVPKIALVALGVRARCTRCCWP
jgi:hypothetical protein